MLLFLHVCVAVWIQQTVNVISFIQKQKANMFADVLAGSQLLCLCALSQLCPTEETQSSPSRGSQTGPDVTVQAAFTCRPEPANRKRLNMFHVFVSVSFVISDWKQLIMTWTLGNMKHDYLSLVISFTIKICFSALKHFQLLLNRAGTSHTSFPNILLLVWMLTSFDFGNRNYQGHMISLALSWNWCTNWS